MSIATRIENMNNNLKNAYESLDGLGIDLMNTDKNLKNLSSKINTLYNEFPQVTEKGTEITLNDTKNARLKMVLKGNTEQTHTTGINLLNLANYVDWSHNSVDITINEDKSFRLNGTVSGGFAYNKSIPNGLVLDGDYTLVLKCTKNIIQNTLTFSLGTGSTITGTSVQNLKANGINITNFTVSNINATEIRCWFNKNNSFDNSEFQLYLLKGTYTAENLPDYEIFTNGASPNPDYPQDIHVVTGNNNIEVHGKNLCSTIMNVNLTSGNEKWSIKSLTTANSNINWENGTTYYIMAFLNKQSNEQVQISNYGYLRIDTQTKSFVFNGTIPTIRVGANTLNNNITNEEVKIMIAKEDFTSYESYYHMDYPINLGSLELCKIGDYQDYLYKENGNWYKYNAINKVILDGTTERWGGVSTSGNFNRIDLKDTGLLNEGSSRKTHLFCSISQASTVEDYNIAFNYTDRIFFYLPQEITTGNEWKALLSQKMPKLYYILETATSIQITDTTLISQLDAIEKAKSDENQTNIAQTNADLPFIINATALLKNN